MMNSVLAPRFTLPVPDKELICAPSLAALISKVPLLFTKLEAAIAPDPDKAKVAPALMFVVPKKSLF